MENKKIIYDLIKNRKVKITGGGSKHIYTGELDEASLWETLEEGILLTKQQLCEKLPNKSKNYTLPYYFLHKLRKFLILGKPVLLGFKLEKDYLEVCHFSGCSAEAKFYEKFKKESQNLSFKN